MAQPQSVLLMRLGKGLERSPVVFAGDINLGRIKMSN